MNALPFCGRALAALVVAATLSGQADGFVVIYGTDEKMAHVRDLPSDVEEDVRREMGHDVAIGFLYERFHVFWLDFWTWGGRHVLYAGDEYWELEPIDWQGLLGEEGSENLSKPILYRFPLGLTIVVGLVIVGVLAAKLFPSDATRARRLLKDERYQQAVQAYAEKVSPPDGSEETPESPAESPKAAFASAVEAERNMNLILRALAAEAEESPSDPAPDGHPQNPEESGGR
ncbi:MAG: hypothetical protein ACYTG0_35370 [Planctomycetota bacterium]|jgi:hypothetical protein